MSRKKLYVRINTRVRKDQADWVKARSKKEKETEGDTYRWIIDYVIALVDKKMEYHDN